MSLNPADAQSRWQMDLGGEKPRAHSFPHPAAKRVVAVLEGRQNDVIGGGHQVFPALVDRNVGDGRVTHQHDGFHVGNAMAPGGAALGTFTLTAVCADVRSGWEGHSSVGWGEMTVS